jgi:bidirectional [NiFe] hydrogenase diaphorase subunit
MAAPQPAPAPSWQHTGGEGFQLIEAALKRHQFRQDALIEVLHAAQQLFGHLEPEFLRFVARRLKLPLSRVYGVATFYHFFTLKPKGAHTCVVCTGTACFVKGAAGLLATAEKAAGVHVGETTADGQLTLTTTRCLGACGVAPVVVLDGAIVPHAKAEELIARTKGWLGRGTE